MVRRRGAKGKLDQVANEAVVTTEVLIQERYVDGGSPAKLGVLRPLKPRSVEVALDIDEEVEFTATTRRVGGIDPPVANENKL